MATSDSTRAVRPLRSAKLADAGFEHGFFTREGGVSPSPWDSLNLATNTGDERARVLENLGRIADALGVEPERVHFPSQVHGTATVQVDASGDRSATAHVEADATLAIGPGVTAAVRSADCGTVLVADRVSGRVLAIHAGWKGTVLGVVHAALEVFLAGLGEERALVAAIGPHIEACCFEVGLDVASELARCSSLGEAAIVARAGAKAHVDLRAILASQLDAAGIAPSALDHVRGCTVCDGARFFSFRRDGARSGRLLSAIVARGPARR